MDDDIWAAIESAGPLARTTTFDPLLVDDVLLAEREVTQYDRRRAFVAAYAWAVPSREAIDRIVQVLKGRAILEVGAGSGLWAKLLSDAGLHVIATDPALSNAGAYFPVEPLEAARAVEMHPECDALLLSWPPFKDDCAFRALKAFENEIVVCIGDARFTADRQFHELLAQAWILEDRIPLPSWPGTDDVVNVYTRSPD